MSWPCDGRREVPAKLTIRISLELLILIRTISQLKPIILKYLANFNMILASKYQTKKRFYQS